MIFDNIDLTQLPPSGEEAFEVFEKQIRKSYEDFSSDDRRDQDNFDQNGNYCGLYGPERAYLNAILAFVDEYNLDIDVPDITALRGYEFLEKFEEVKAKIGYSVLRFALRKNRIDDGTVGTLISISSTYKSEIGSLLETIRKIVNQEVQDVKKRDKIVSKIASLQSEIDRDQTTVDALFGRMIDLSHTVGECAENLEPLISKLERIKRIFWENSNKVKLLPKKERQKLITQQDNKPSSPNIDDIKDEIPF